MSNKELVKELYKPIITKFGKRKLYSSFKYHVWGADLTDMQLLSKYSKEIRFLLTVIDIYSKYAWAVSLEVKKGITITSAFQKICMSLLANQRKHW